MISQQGARVILIKESPSNEVSTISEVEEATSTCSNDSTYKTLHNHHGFKNAEIQPNYFVISDTDTNYRFGKTLAPIRNAMEEEKLLSHTKCNGRASVYVDDDSPAHSSGQQATGVSSQSIPSSVTDPRFRIRKLKQRSYSTDPVPSDNTQCSNSLVRHDSSNQEGLNHAYSEKLHPENETYHRQKRSSTLSNIGVEYMRAAGAMGVRFKQLQRPPSHSQDGIYDSKQGVNDEAMDSVARSPPSIVRNLCNELPIVVPMDNNLTKSVKQQQIDVEKNLNAPSKVEKPSRAIPSRSFSHGHHIGYRLGQRKTLAEYRRKLADYSCLLALIGILFMVVETECTMAELYSKDEVASYVLKGFISLTTLGLLGLIGTYHAIEVKLFVVDNCIEDWRISMSWKRIFQIIIELIICAIHPVPGSAYFNWTIVNIKSASLNDKKEDLEYHVQKVPVDIILSIPMLIRLYLIVRVLLLHSKLFTDASSRSIGALNKITFNTRFVLKTLMNILPGTVLGLFMMSLWIIFAWTLRACESFHDPLLGHLLNALYMIAITFLSVGYGDFVPYTYCGRTISVLSGLMGAGCTALAVAVIAKKLELTRAEKHVHNFMIENQLSKKLKDAAANVLRETWLIYKYTKMVKRVNQGRVRVHQRKFLTAISELRKVKLKQRKLADQSNSLTDFAKTTSHILEVVSDMKHGTTYNEKRLDKLEKSILNLKLQIDALPNVIAIAVADYQPSSSYITADEASAPNSPPSFLNRRRKPQNQSSMDST